MKRLIIAILVVIALALPAQVALAATTADVTVTATPNYVAIADNVTSIDFGGVDTSTSYQTSTSHVGITNTSSIQTDQTIGVTSATWTGGTNWTHSDTDTPGADTVGMLANRGGTWGVSDVIVKFAAPNFIYENCPALTDYDYGLQMDTPTSFSDGTEKTNTVRVTAAAG